MKIIQQKPESQYRTAEYVQKMVEKARAGKATSNSREDRLARLLQRALSDEPIKDNCKG